MRGASARRLSGGSATSLADGNGMLTVVTGPSDLPIDSHNAAIAATPKTPVATRGDARSGDARGRIRTGAGSFAASSFAAAGACSGGDSGHGPGAVSPGGGSVASSRSPGPE